MSRLRNRDVTGFNARLLRRRARDRGRAQPIILYFRCRAWKVIWNCP
jgi:hypothetical protein